MNSGKRVVVVMTGSIAAYKIAHFVRLLVKGLVVKGGVKVNVVMTKAACEFITPLTMSTLSGNPVTLDLFEPCASSGIKHIDLGDEADVVLVAPATANIIAKMARGIADDAASALLLATKAPILVAPAMNVNMWEHQATQENLGILRARGVSIIEPETGELACGWTGQGRLASIDHIAQKLRYMVSQKDLIGSRVVIAAGPTREHLDPLQFIGSASTGVMGHAIATAAYLRGASVHLVTGPTNILQPFGVNVYNVVSACDMRDKLFEILDSARDECGCAGRRAEGDRTADCVGANCDSDREPFLCNSRSEMAPQGCPGEFVFMEASVCYYRPETFSTMKMEPEIGQDDARQVMFVRNPDILSELGQRRISRGIVGQTLIGFSAWSGEEENMLAATRAKLERKQADLMVGKFSAYSFEDDTRRVWLIDRNGREEEITSSDQLVIADRIINAALHL